MRQLPRQRNPYPTVDVIASSVSHPDCLVMVRRRYEPLGWALPGGFVDWGESAETAAARELEEETGLKALSLRQFAVYSDPARDPRGHTLSVVFSALVDSEPEGADDAEAAEWISLLSLPEDITFDHAGIIRDWIEAGRPLSGPRFRRP